MNCLFYRNSVRAEELSYNIIPKKKFDACPFCNKQLLVGHDDYGWYNHELYLDYGFCPRCGWWDLIYREGGEPGYFEEQCYVHAVLKELHGSDLINFACTTLINELVQNPKRIYDIAPRDLELIVRSIFCDILDCSAEVTKSTRDGGKDIYGFDSNGGPFLVEVKRFRIQRKVGVSIIRDFLGALVIDNVHNGFIITTSTFTKDAIKVKNHINKKGIIRLELSDVNDLVSWLKLSFKRYFDWELLKSEINKYLYHDTWGPTWRLDGFPKPWLNKV